MKKINTILFDLDGTLVDSNELIIYSFKETFKKYQPEKNYSRVDLIEMIGPPLKETFKTITSNQNKIDEIINFYRKIYQKNEFDFIKIYDNAIKVLDILKSRNFNLGIVTTKFKESALPSIEHYNINKYIKHYSFLGDVDEHKPSPKPVYHLLNQFNKVEKALIIGDTPSDILAGKNAKIYTCGVNWSLKKEELQKVNPDFWINEFLDILNIIDKEI
ncbi:MAG: HAD-IA family hydrolase [Candidatus Izemoplasmatales bacterium]|nr:HAD-IA family hydrolase [Candidatus Izemoplasmatales bacterium]